LQHVFHGHAVERSHIDCRDRLMRDDDFVRTFGDISRFQPCDIELALEAARTQCILHSLLLETAYAEIDQRPLRVEAKNELLDKRLVLRGRKITSVVKTLDRDIE